jgi:hypothetical protein
MAKKQQFRVPAGQRFDQYADEDVFRDKPKTIESGKKALQGRRGDSIVKGREDVDRQGDEGSDRYRRERAKVAEQIAELQAKIAKLDAAHDAFLDSLPSPTKDTVQQAAALELLVVDPADLPTLEDVEELGDIKE